jgi:hypothetical protein
VYRAIPIVVLIVAVVTLLVGVNHRPGTSEGLEFALGWALRAGGGLIALIAASVFLAGWLRGERFEKLTTGGIVVIAGLAVGFQSWPMVVSLGAIIVTHLVTSARRGVSPDTRAGDSPGGVA